MAEFGKPEDLLKNLDRVVKKSVEASTTYWKDMAITWQQFYTSQKSGVSVDGIVDTLADSWKHWVQLQIKYAESLYDLSFENTKSKTEVFEEAPIVQEKRKEMFLQGVPGETAVMLIRLRSNDNLQYNCRLESNGFTDVLRGNPVAFYLRFTPETFVLLPNEEVEAQMYVSVPADANPGHYKTTIVINGYKNSIFDLILSVQSQQIPVEKPQEENPPKPAPRRATSRSSKPRGEGLSVKKTKVKKS
ncbi:hypothetical protein [Haliscomenobacter hydrossis]|uniref:Uncharacterized protein n=1 Tax=Haliscomenobacter hydrossis (strain ATCC 27775 / DSM 1100 / LMG 10767 / O) TaxID=760192 RepID=F4L049_HALH1|nr:hypothetical protein [Haliscomenobacter hydrossis]AEE52758.1 hypothetical protein Halhy_4930 [Haliscomenobacter hydrossis DSM 1100]